MSDTAASQKTPESNSESNTNARPVLISLGSLSKFWRAVTAPAGQLDANDAASTLFRFFRSQHVVDLKLIATLAIIFLLVHFLLVLGFAVGLHVKASDIPSTLATYVGPAIPICGLIIGWAYLSAATRLGVVDLFACEISTLCRVGSLFDLGILYVDMHQRYAVAALSGAMEEPATAQPLLHPEEFVSNEDYFPIFAANSRDLQALEALVVGNIAEFYTYMKATRDILRNVADAKTSRTPTAVANLIYVLYLGYESGRKAIEDLIEFEPSRAENMMVILLTELVCYSALCKYFKDDTLRFSRLKLREKDYKKKVPDLYREVKAPHGTNEPYWETAKQTTSELAKRYKDAFGEDIDGAVAE